MSMISDIKQLKKDIQDQKDKRSRLEGRKEELLKQLKQETGHSTITKAKEFLVQQEKSVEQSNIELKKLKEQLDNIMREFND